MRFIALMCMASVLGAQTGPVAVRGRGSNEPAPRRFITTHTATINGQRVDYRAIVEEWFVRDDQGRRVGNIVSTTYVRTNVLRPGARPVTFFFNGGPGQSTMFMHMGFLSPRRADLGTPEKPITTPPFSVVDNPDSPLDVTDIVSYDAGNTGFGRIDPGAEHYALGVDQDAAIVANLVREWSDRYGRWNSPKYLMGESYGSIRAAVSARHLSGRDPQGRSVPLNGVIVVGQAMDWSPGRAGDGDLRAAKVLGSMAAAAWYHGKVDRRGMTVSQFFETAKSFGETDYLTALRDYSSLSADQKTQIANRIAGFIGLDPGLILASNLRINNRLFLDSLLRKEGRYLSTNDARYGLETNGMPNSGFDDEPMYAQITPAIYGATVEYYRGELRADFGVPYVGMISVSGKWDCGRGRTSGGGGWCLPPDTTVPGRDQNFGNDLALAMRRNPSLKVLVGNGFYDFLTPIGAAEILVQRSKLDRSRVSFFHSEAGHMTYIGSPGRAQVAAALREFIRSTSSTR